MGLLHVYRAGEWRPIQNINYLEIIHSTEIIDEGVVDVIPYGILAATISMPFVALDYMPDACEDYVYVVDTGVVVNSVDTLAALPAVLIPDIYNEISVDDIFELIIE